MATNSKKTKVKITPVMLAKDVLSWFEKGKKKYKITPKKGYGYCSVGFRQEYENDYKSVGPKGKLDELVKAGEPCKVCGIGAFLVAKALRVDGVKIKNGLLEDGYSQRPSTGQQREEVFKSLSKIFSEKQLNDIEETFEYFPEDVGLKDSSSAVARLKAICRNIIKNKGEFVPKVEEY